MCGWVGWDGMQTSLHRAHLIPLHVTATSKHVQLIPKRVRDVRGARQRGGQEAGRCLQWSGLQRRGRRFHKAPLQRANTSLRAATASKRVEVGS